MLSFTEEERGGSGGSSSGSGVSERRVGMNDGENDNQIEMSDVSSTNIAFNSFPEDLRDDENASILENDVNANVEEQIRAEEEAEERANNGNAGRRNVQIDPLVAAGIDQAEELIPNRSVPLGTLFRSDSFMTVLYSIVLISTLGIALLVDRDHKCTNDAPPLRTWAVVQLILQCVSFVDNYACVRMYVADPEAAVQKLLFKFTLLLGRVIHVLWFISFIVGTVYTFKFSNNSCKYELPYLYSVCTAITYFNLFVVIFFLFSFCCCCCLLYVRLRLQDRYTQTQVAVPAEETVIQALPTAEFKEGLMDPSDARCAICLCDYEEGEKIRYLPCHHHFHLECIDTWLITNKNCPFCKHPVDTPLGEDEKDSEFLSHNTIPTSPNDNNDNNDTNNNNDNNDNNGNNVDLIGVNESGTENSGNGVIIVDDNDDEKDEKDEMK